MGRIRFQTPLNRDEQDEKRMNRIKRGTIPAILDFILAILIRTGILGIDRITRTPLPPASVSRNHRSAPDDSRVDASFRNSTRWRERGSIPALVAGFRGGGGSGRGGKEKA